MEIAESSRKFHMAYGPVHLLVNCVNHVVKGIATTLREVVNDFKGNSIETKLRLAL